MIQFYFLEEDDLVLHEMFSLRYVELANTTHRFAHGNTERVEKKKGERDGERERVGRVRR